MDKLRRGLTYCQMCNEWKSKTLFTKSQCKYCSKIIPICNDHNENMYECPVCDEKKLCFKCFEEGECCGMQKLV